MSQYINPIDCVRILREGSPTEIDKIIYLLYQQFKQPVMRYVYQQGGDEEDACDIFQEIMLVFVRQVRTFRFEATTLTEMEGYFIRVARYKWMKKQEAEGRRVQREQRYVYQETIFHDANSLDLLIEEEERAKAYDLLKQLGEKCQAILLAFYGDKYSLSQIAIQLGMADATLVKAQKYRCLTKLKNLHKSNEA